MTDAEIRSRLEKSRLELLDLTTRNRLLHCPASRVGGIEIVEEKASEVFQILAIQRKAMTFDEAPGQSEAESDGDQAAVFGQPKDFDVDPKRYTDTRLQTTLGSEALQKALLRVERQAKTLVEEQGFNTLYLALGFLHWKDGDKSRRAPLLLLPVELKRKGAASRFQLSLTDDDIESNLSLEEKMKTLGVALPPFPESDDLDPSAYFDSVAAAVRTREDWHVRPDAMRLAFFSFTKLRMYRDLDPAAWTERPLERHALLRGLMGAQELDREPEETVPEFLDDHSPAVDLSPIHDADSSQLQALLRARVGRSMIIQGPPGTGKSQTIANLIGQALTDGKKALFVAEKLAALEVVMRRLEQAGVGDACLELHSRTSNKRAVLEELDRTLNLAEPRLLDAAEDGDLAPDRERLNAYCRAVGQPIGDSGVLPRDAFVAWHRATWRLEPESAPAVTIPGAAEWNADRLQAMRRTVRELAAAREALGMAPQAHPFAGSAIRSWTPMGDSDLRTLLQEARSAVERAQGAAARVAELAGAEPATQRREALGHLEAAAQRASAPDLSGCALQSTLWEGAGDDIAKMTARGRRLFEVEAAWGPTLRPEADGAPALAWLANVQLLGDKWWRFLSGTWRRTVREMQTVVRGPLPRSSEEKIRLLEAIHERQTLREELQSHRLRYEALFGEAPSNWASVDWELRETQQRWIREARASVAGGRLPEWALRLDAHRLPALQAAAQDCSQSLEASSAALTAADHALESREPSSEIRWDSATASLDRMRDNLASLPVWASYQLRRQEAVDQGLAAWVEACDAWPGPAGLLQPLFERSVAKALLERVLAERPALREFERLRHELTRQRFQDADRAALTQNRQRAASAHHQGLPHRQGGGRMGLLRTQMARRRGHWPVRRLLQETGPAVQAVKPVFLMSPLSVAQFLAPGAVEFDLVVFDEASQVKAIDAYGAIVRARQAIVVGDSRQLPPTDFFETLTAGDEEDEQRPDVDIESILKQFEARGAPEEWLRWHYRSRHESLIAFSNQRFYEGKLYDFPSPVRDSSELGLSFVHVPHAVYNRGAKRADNPLEAQAVATAVFEHARLQLQRSSGERASLLVATFSSSQRDAITERLEILRRKDATCEEFFAAEAEPFDVKNLENVQGDERDVVFISVGYGRDAEGALTMSFGPLNREGGQRRLNVLCTRARQRCVVFSSLRSQDIRIGERTPEGVQALASFLHLAEHGALDKRAQASVQDRDSLVEEVADALAVRGYETVRNAGDSTYRMDLAVVDPQRPATYLLGIECDGLRYQSARTARDRERIRPAVLRGLGWSLATVWAKAWFDNPAGEIERLVAILEDLRRARAAAPVPAPTPPPLAAPVREEVDEPGDRPAQAVAAPYAVAEPSLSLPGCELHEASPSLLAEWLVSVVAIEQPVHAEIAFRRIATAVGVQRIGVRIQNAFEEAAAHARRRGSIEIVDEFFSLPAAGPAPVRDRSALSALERRIDRIAAAEIDAAIRGVVERSHGVHGNEIAPRAAGLFGLRTGKLVREGIDARVAVMLHQGLLRRSGNFLEWAGPTDSAVAAHS
ncbi:MAG: DUF3320 domain-containing protein [Acidobacteria bacterium]|nr:DUF3320 domain-containing protein [Acidobacteriota bacterium]